MSDHEKPAGPSAAAAASQKSLPASPGTDPVAAAEEHLANVDMAAQRAILKQLTR